MAVPGYSHDKASLQARLVRIEGQVRGVQRMVVCVAVTGDGQIDPRWGRARRVAIAAVEAGAITGWEEFDVSWDTLHDAEPEGAHHAGVARFLREHRVDTVLAHHMGGGMAHMLQKLGVTVHFGVVGDARQAVLAVAR